MRCQSHLKREEKGSHRPTGEEVWPTLLKFFLGGGEIFDNFKKTKIKWIFT